MFGLRQTKKEWSWIAYGKHPSIKDYITIGKEGALFSAFSKWMDNGFRAIRDEIVSDISWRFIAPVNNDHVACGILKNSKDSMNRTFPLLLMGDGYLKNWIKYWSYMPFACENVWTQADQITTAGSSTIIEIEDGINRVGKPDENYDTFKNQMDRLREMNLMEQSPGLNRRFKDKLNNIDGILRNDIFLFNFGSIGVDSMLSLYSVTTLLNTVKNRMSKPPSMILWGGSSQSTWIFTLKRPLKQDDFRTIWTIDGREC